MTNDCGGRDWGARARESTDCRACERNTLAMGVFYLETGA